MGGLQGLVEHFGGKLGQLPLPMHGKPSRIDIIEKADTGGIFAGLPENFSVARYHSLYATRPLPECLVEVAHVSRGEPGGLPSEGRGQGADEPIIMAIQHRTLPIAAVQFHPESILTSPELGLRMISNALSSLSYSGKS